MASCPPGRRSCARTQSRNCQQHRTQHTAGRGAEAGGGDGARTALAGRQAAAWARPCRMHPARPTSASPPRAADSPATVGPERRVRRAQQVLRFLENVSQRAAAAACALAPGARGGDMQHHPATLCPIACARMRAVHQRNSACSARMAAYHESARPRVSGGRASAHAEISGNATRAPRAATRAVQSRFGARQSEHRVHGTTARRVLSTGTMARVRSAPVAVQALQPPAIQRPSRAATRAGRSDRACATCTPDATRVRDMRRARAACIRSPARTRASLRPVSLHRGHVDPTGMAEKLGVPPPSQPRCGVNWTVFSCRSTGTPMNASWGEAMAQNNLQRQRRCHHLSHVRYLICLMRCIRPRITCSVCERFPRPRARPGAPNREWLGATHANAHPFRGDCRRTGGRNSRR
jgi:hypothetical protein